MTWTMFIYIKIQTNDMNPWRVSIKCSQVVILILIISYCPCLFVTTLWSSVTTAKHQTCHLSCHTTTPPCWVEHGRLVEHQHLISCRMVAGAVDTPVGSVEVWLDTTLCRICFTAIHTGWGPNLEGQTEWLISIWWRSAEHDAHAAQRHHVMEAITSILKQRQSMCWPS